jgi:hypothetical protein
MTPLLGLSRDDDVVRELLAPYARVQPVTLKCRPARRWPRRFALAAVALGLTGVIATVAVAGTGWLVGSPAPPDVKEDFGSYATQLGFNPQPDQAVALAGSGAYQLYGTMNAQGGLCTLVVTPWNPPSSDQGGDCTAAPPDASTFWASIGGQAGETNGETTVVTYGHTNDSTAASVQFEGPTGEPVTASVSKSGFFIVPTTVSGTMCDWGKWAPTFNVLDATGHQLSSATLTLKPATKWMTIGSRGRVCIATAAGPGARVTPTK